MRNVTIGSMAVAATLGLCAFVAPQTAHAGKDMRMRFGLGGQRTLSGYSQIRARFFPITNLHVGLGFGVVILDPEGDADPMVLGTVSPEVMGWYVTDTEGIVSANFGGGLRFGAVFGENGIDDADEGDRDDPLEFDIELPITAEVFLGNHFSIAPEFGVVFRIIPGSNEDGDVNPGAGCASGTSPLVCGTGASLPSFGFELGQNTGLFGGGSMNFFF